MQNTWRSIDDYNFIDFDYLNKETESKLDKRFSLVNKKFKEKIKDNNYYMFFIDKYDIVYIIEDKYAIFIGVLYDLWKTDIRETNLKYSDEEYINKVFSIFINELVYDDKLNINIEELINTLNNNFNYNFVRYCSVCQYLVRSCENKYPQYYTDEEYRKDLVRFDDNDKFQSIALKLLPKFNLYELLKRNQECQNINDNYDIYEARKYFMDVINLIKNELKDYSYKIYNINMQELVFIFEDSLVMYIGLKGMASLFRDKQIKNGNVINRYAIVIQELTNNDVFNQKMFSNFIKQIHLLSGSNMGTENYNNIYYRPFNSGDTEERITKGYHPRIYSNSNFNYVNKVLPEINLQQRYDSWQGFEYYYIVYEIRVNGIVGIAVTRTTDSRPNFAARTLLKNLEHAKIKSYNAFSSDENWGKCIRILTQEAKKNNWQNVKRNKIDYSLLAEKVSYYIVPTFIKNKNYILEKQEEILKQAKSKINDITIERQVYDLLEYKWKSEELMFECIRKIFKNNNVIHQYRPYFLHTSTGQLSYDVFVCGKNIAFEYQGKQHFEPVDIFGGKQNFKKQQKRDKIKKELSDKNKVKLIYINYWEDINVDLIKQKLKDNNI